jgi:hypothetical protein
MATGDVDLFTSEQVLRSGAPAQYLLLEAGDALIILVSILGATLPTSSRGVLRRRRSQPLAIQVPIMTNPPTAVTIRVVSAAIPISWRPCACVAGRGVWWSRPAAQLVWTAGPGRAASLAVVLAKLDVAGLRPIATRILQRVDGQRVARRATVIAVCHRGGKMRWYLSSFALLTLLGELLTGPTVAARAASPGPAISSTFVSIKAYDMVLRRTPAELQRTRAQPIGLLHRTGECQPWYAVDQ